MTSYRSVRTIQTAQPQQVGDGFVGKNAFHPQSARPFSPFLLLDHHGPMTVAPSNRQKGVDEHPHRGFETVTVVYEGALEHRDSAGNRGKLFAGDVQWMTAASGIVHEEKHELAFSKTGGILDFVQLWVNLPAKDKMRPPRYQELQSTQFPKANIAPGAALRVIAGEAMGLTGPAQTFSPLLLADLTLTGGTTVELPIQPGFNLMLYALKGTVQLNQTDTLTTGQIALFELTGGDSVHISATTEAKLLVLAGEPLNEPLAAYGPFVMNTREELLEAFADFQAGKMGSL
ncbi:pirin family protein [Fibrella sp. HMF5335]|uniref:Pirin family protein n=1 Tax=Fibrella rubiginis TaxID=2817060 RepID=A0A939GL59_9BACT|nr:pirin family protein [Fibrella rubiginis]MBO0938432.1 pirin family protein [Fibrella rubiginis]